MSDRPELKAPTSDGGIVAVPPLADAGQLISDNRRGLRSRSLAHLTALRQSACSQAIAAALRYHAARGEPTPDVIDTDRVIAAGHQPELFHPGVWVKNFALAGLARRHGCVSLNLIVDNDTVKSTALRVPVASSEHVPRPHAVSLPFDRWLGEAPWEERTIQDDATFATFADRANEALARWEYPPLLREFWPEALSQAQRSRIVGDCFATARRSLERRWGCHNLELPVSALCGTPAFQIFATHLLAELPRFHALYNDCVHDYRRSHGIRSRNHPVPDLAVEDDWVETPFWGWRAGAARRGRLFARVLGERIQLRVGTEIWPDLTSKHPGESWPAEESGYKIRSRALSNTLYARLVLADLFLHGIGGGKYDELTDDLIRRFYGIEPPAFLVLTATKRLPLPRLPATEDDRRRLLLHLRELHWNPQRHLPNDAVQLQALASERAGWLRTVPSDAPGRHERHRALRALTAQLRDALANQSIEVREKLAECEQALASNSALQRRDYAFVLYPESLLRPFCTQFLGA